MGQHCYQMYQIGTHLALVHKNLEADTHKNLEADGQLIPNLEIL